MKKLLVTVAAIFAIALLLTGCPGSPKDDENTGGNETPARKKATGKLGEWEGVYEVGDIVFTDGSATPYSTNLTLTDAQKAGAIAIIFYKGHDLNSGSGTKTRTLGVGLIHSTEKMMWSFWDYDLDNGDVIEAEGTELKITPIICDLDRSLANQGKYLSTGDKDGSDNLTAISQFLTSKGKTDDTNNAAMYPAFYFAKNYKNQSGVHVSGTNYEDGWFLPSVGELRKVWEYREIVSGVCSICGGSQFVTSGHDNENDGYEHAYYYWSSSQDSVGDDSAMAIDFAGDNNGGTYQPYTKYYTGYTIAIREF